MTAQELAEKIAARFETRDVFEISRKAGVRVVTEKWFPVTLGEFDHRAKTITVNENAAAAPEKIVAHELAHYFLREYAIEVITDEENFCDRFAESLLKNE